MKLIWESDHDVPDAALTAQAVPHTVELKCWHRPRMDENDDAIRQAGGASERLALKRSIPSFE